MGEGVQPLRLTITGTIEISGDIPRLVSAKVSGPASPRRVGGPAGGGYRRRRHVTYEWPAGEVVDLDRAHRRLRARHASPFPGGKGTSPRLTRSALLAAAIDKAMDDELPWIATVRNDGRGRGPRPAALAGRKVTLVYPPEVRARFEAFFRDLEDAAEGIWGAGFTPTRSNVALAAARYGLRGARWWLPPLKT